MNEQLFFDDFAEKTVDMSKYMEKPASEQSRAEQSRAEQSRAEQSLQLSLANEG